MTGTAGRGGSLSGSAGLALAVAGLLRLADADLRDAAVLASGRRPGNALALAAQAVVRMVDAVLATENGWKGISVGGNLGLVSDRNSSKASLARAAELLPLSTPPLPDGAGKIAAPLGREALLVGMAAARSVLDDLAARFEVDLAGDGPAGRTASATSEATLESLPVSKSSMRVAHKEAVPPRANPVAGRGLKASDTAVRRTVPVRPQPAPSPVKSEAPRPSKAAASAKQAARLPPSPPRKTTAEAESGAPPVRRVTTPVVLKFPVRPVETTSPADPHEVRGRTPIEPRPRPATTASTVFWSLVDRWNVADAAALELIGHPGGLTKKGTRPRFRLQGDEVDMLAGLQEIDAALVPLKLEPAKWVHDPAGEAPFGGATPLAYMTRERMPGVREALRFILRHGLRMSMTT